jgi:PTS system nitrogen regulatory IIA component
MAYRTFNLEELAEYLHLTPNDIERLLRETDLPRDMRGGQMRFRRDVVDEWASKRILQLPEKRLDAFHVKTLPAMREVYPEGALIPALLRPEYIDLALPSKTPSSTIRDMADLANRTGRVIDVKELIESLRGREKISSTAVPGGLALLHPQNHTAYRFEGSFIVIGRTIQGVPFSAPDGKPTRLFFLICCHDDRIHLNTLARISLLARKTDLIRELLVADDIEAAYGLLVSAEKLVLPVEQTK